MKLTKKVKKRKKNSAWLIKSDLQILGGAIVGGTSVSVVVVSRLDVVAVCGPIDVVRSVDVELVSPLVVDASVDVELDRAFVVDVVTITTSRMRVPSIGTLMLKECLKSAINTSFF